MNPLKEFVFQQYSENNVLINTYYFRYVPLSFNNFSALLQATFLGQPSNSLGQFALLQMK